MNVGDPITFVYWNESFALAAIEPEQQVWRGEVKHVFGDLLGVSGMVWPSVGARTVQLRREQEGVTWIRGHHADDSEEGLALMAANALTR